MFFVRRIVLQQLRQRQSSSLMHSGADNGFDRFQVESALAAAFPKNDSRKTVCFFGDLTLDLF